MVPARFAGPVPSEPILPQQNDDECIVALHGDPSIRRGFQTDTVKESKDEAIRFTMFQRGLFTETACFYDGSADTACGNTIKCRALATQPLT